MKKSLRGRSPFLILPIILFACACNGQGGHENNYAPEITSSPVTTAITCELYSYPVTAVDRDKNPLTYSLTTSPQGMGIDSITGKITWTPTLKQVGNHQIEVWVTDGRYGDIQVFAVRVIPLDNGVPFQRGFTLVSWWNDSYLQPASDQSLAELAQDGVEWVSILVTWYVDNTSSTYIHPDVDTGDPLNPIFPVTPSDEALIHAITTAQSLGMNVVLKPHIDVQTFEWRGKINFFGDEAAWQTWFQNYNQFLGHYLDLAEDYGVKAVIIGTELKSTEGRDADWRNTIALARTRFSGLLTYCANHDSFFNVSWWDALDFIGISAYFPLTDSNDPTVEEIKAAWEVEKFYVPIIRAFAALFEKDIVFLEIGYQSRDGANIKPYQATANPPDLQEQADCYQAALETFYSEPWFKGMYWWAWSWDPSTDDNGFDVYNKPAETILREWYAGY